MRADLFCNLAAKIVRGYAKLPHSHDKKSNVLLNFAISRTQKGRFRCALLCMTGYLSLVSLGFQVVYYLLFREGHVRIIILKRFCFESNIHTIDGHNATLSF